MSNLTGTTYTANHSRSASTGKSAFKMGPRDDPFIDNTYPADRPYAVAVTSGQETDDTMSWDGVEHHRSLSEERMAQPGGIYKTTMIVKSSFERIPKK